MDATQISSRERVYIKRIRTGSDEEKIAMMLSSDILQRDPRNHCIRVLDLFQDDEDPLISYMVMPFLRACDSPGFETVDDIVDFVTQILEVRACLDESCWYADCGRDWCFCTSKE